MVFREAAPKEVLKSFNIVRIGEATLEDLLDPSHELVKLAGVMDLQAFEEKFGRFFKNERGRPPIKTRAIVGVLYLKHTCYSHAKQFRRARKCRKRLMTIVSYLLREISRKGDESLFSNRSKLHLSIARRISDQMRTSKDKVYSFHAPEVECISKGKAHKRYEFGCKASIVTTNRSNRVVGAKALHGKPYDGHTLIAALNQVKLLTGKYPSRTYTDKGYRG